MNIKVKICGLTTQEAIDAAVQGGAEYLGFIFFPPSPRHVTAEKAQALTASVSASVKKVAVTVDMPDAELTALLNDFSPDYLQLHGHETPERVRDVKTRYGLPVIKAVSVRESDDIARALPYTEVADMLLFDAKAPAFSALPGGNGIAFDWQLLKGREFSLPWMLSGGLNAENVAEAVRITGASMLDASSGLERAPGVKDVALIMRFLQAVKSL